MNAHERTCQDCKVGGSSIFGNICSCDQALVLQGKHIRTFTNGAIIYYAGDVANTLFCVRAGNVKVYSVGADGREQTLRLVRPGEIMGYRALILGGAHESFAMALDNVQVCAIAKDTFNTIVQRNPAFNHKLLAVMASELNTLEYQMTNLVQRPVIQRLAELLLTWRQVYGTIADGKTIALQITRIELAKVLGTTPETVSRSLSHLQHDGLITIHGKAIGIDDTGGLVDLTLLHD